MISILTVADMTRSGCVDPVRSDSPAGLFADAFGGVGCTARIST
jgi:hypothetical protein